MHLEDPTRPVFPKVVDIDLLGVDANEETKLQGVYERKKFVKHCTRHWLGQRECPTIVAIASQYSASTHSATNHSTLHSTGSIITRQSLKQSALDVLQHVQSGVYYQHSSNTHSIRTIPTPTRIFLGNLLQMAERNFPISMPTPQLHWMSQHANSGSTIAIIQGFKW